MKIIDALKSNDYAARVSCGCRWLVYDDSIKNWIVYGHKPYQKKTRILVQTKNEEEAVAVLVKD